MRGQCAVLSATIRGVEAVPVFVEVTVSSGLPGMSIVGMPDAAVQEARERVRASVRASGFSMPQDRIVVNLAPSSLRKTGSGFDLPIAVGILVSTGQIDAAVLQRRLFVGELSLDGGVRPVAGMLAYGVCARSHGCGLVCAQDSALVPLADLEQKALSHLGRLHATEPLVDMRSNARRVEAVCGEGLDFVDVAGHDVAKRAFQIAATGDHGLLMSGPPGSGKTMLASRMPSILPPLDESEMLETAVIHSVAGEDIDDILCGVRPFRHPHHSATIAGLVGGGNPLRPGEISLAHNGVLFLDELAEFKSSVLQSLRQPLESGRVVLTRADGSVSFPSRFLLVSATNPCPCGYLGDPDRECTCTFSQVRQYQARIGGPLVDRISIQIDVRRVDPSNVISSTRGVSSSQLRDGVLRGRAFGLWRRSRCDGEGSCRSVAGNETYISTHPSIADECGLTDEARTFLEAVARASALSGRAVVSSLRVARTIADIEESVSVSADHVAEALGYRLRTGGVD